VDIPFTNIDAKALLDYYDDAADEEYLLLELHRRVLHNNKVNMAKAAARRSDS
jgi:hypothetical protein